MTKSLLILDNEAVQAAADPRHRKHRSAIAWLEAAAQENARRPDSFTVVIPTTVQVEAGWSPRDPTGAVLNRFAPRISELDRRAANAAAIIARDLKLSVADSHIAAIVDRHAGCEIVVLSSDTSDLNKIAKRPGAQMRHAHI